MLSSLFPRRPAASDPALFGSPPGTTVVQRYRNTLGPLEGAVVLVHTSADVRSSSHAAACLGCTYRAARNDRRARPGETEAAELANAHAAHFRAINRGLPTIPDDDTAAQFVLSRLRCLRPYGPSPYAVHLTDFLADRVDLQRDDDFVKQAMFEIARTEGTFLTTEPAYSGSTGTRFLLQPPRK
ncbi:hypothetical protein [Streptomyces sp. NRRL S-241]|uniref:hypothetical protein n=1 Tax=Streptomyces sp. NRRL S-241 TaxID=1463896 RepID=UPI00068C5572|nr:hypothetical protein [Streptomyces sp. NRRL S-241]